EREAVGETGGRVRGLTSQRHGGRDCGSASGSDAQDPRPDNEEGDDTGEEAVLPHGWRVLLKRGAPGGPGAPPSRRRPGQSPELAEAALWALRSEEHTSELQSRENLVCRLLL